MLFPIDWRRVSAVWERQLDLFTHSPMDVPLMIRIILHMDPVSERQYREVNGLLSLESQWLNARVHT